MSLHLARLPVDMSALAQAAGERGWTRGRRFAFDEGAALHHLLGEAFGPAALQPFRLMVAARARTGTLYAYTAAEADALRAAPSMIAMTQTAEAAIAPTRIETKPMPTDWRRGQRLGFDLRVRPVVRIAQDIPAPEDRCGRRRHGFRRGAEVDAFLAEALRHADRAAMDADGRTREAVYADWLQARIGDAAKIEHARLVKIARTFVARGGRAVEGPDAILQGALTIGDPGAFSLALSAGVGRHRSYGFGMILLRPAGRPAPAR